MVYCKLSKIEVHEKERVGVYACGSSINDMSGMVEFYMNGRPPEILKQPESEPIRVSYLLRMWIKNRDKIVNGNFPEKMALEF